MATEIILLNANDFTSQTYGEQDVNLISTFDVTTYLSSSSYIEFFIYDNNQNILSSQYNFSQYTVLNNGQSPGSNDDISQIEINPEENLVNLGYDQGQYITYYNFFNKQIGSEVQQLYISEISSDRTEVRLDSTSLTNADIVEQANNLILQRENSLYFLDFYLNFGDNQLSIANNIQLDDTDPNNPTILIKLYEALPDQFDLNSTLWVVTLFEESTAYQVTFEDSPIIILDTVPAKGPNFNLAIKDQINNSTLSYDYTLLTTTALSSSYNQLSSLLEEKEIDINIDYTDFSQFTHFSSIQTRLENFYYKVSLLEDYSSSIATLNNTTNNNPSASIAIYEAKINNIITNFDGYDYYLYYTSGSGAWPKSTSQPPYALYPIGSPEVLTWYGSDNESSPYYGGIILSASIFDNNNPNNLYYSIPEYLREDPSNEPYQLFVEMVGQFYDNIWVYYKDVTEKYNADNRLENGVSKDIVADAIRDFGIKLYQNNFSNEDLYTAFLGLTPNGALFPFPNITGSLPTPTGFEYVDTLISASNDYIPLDDVNKSLYKRIYHNIPYLLKAKGTLPALRTLITSYGIPDTVLRINEYGGKDRVAQNDWDYWQNTFNYAFYTTGSNYISSIFGPINPSWDSLDNLPNSVALRFKTNGLPTSSIPASQSLWNTDDSNLFLNLRYAGTGYNTNPPTPNNPLGLPYSGSVVDPYYQYAYLDFYPNVQLNPSISASVYLPFFNGDWWSVVINRDPFDATNSTFTLFSGNKVYEGGDNGTSIGFFESSSVTSNYDEWVAGGLSNFAKGPVTINGDQYEAFSGSLQEIRYYTNALDKDIIKNYVMNPHSIQGNSLNSTPTELIFRAPLGGELYTGSVSIHPKVTGSWVTTSSFNLDSTFTFFTTPTFNPNTEYFFYDQPAVGIKNAVSDKIRLEDEVYPSGDTLSPFRSLAQNVAVSSSYTANTNLLEVAFSPQDEINEDIMDQIGFFNIGEYIGDPRLRSSSAESYPALDKLRNDYFEKYTSNYDLVDYIRLIKFFDNSLFKMIKDFVPARTSLASGIVIKQHILERNKYPQPKVNNYSTIAYYTSGSNPPSGSGSINNSPLTFQNIAVSGTIAPAWNNFQPGTIENFSGGTGGTFEIFNGVNTSPYGPNGTGPNNIFNITQSWYENTITPSGSILILHDAQDEFYDGEFSGSIITVTTQSLAQPYNIENISVNYKHVYYYGISPTQNDIFESNFLSPQTSPQPGEILFFNYERSTFYSNPTLNSYTTTFVKIAKKDCDGNDNSLPLGQITKFLIFNPNQAIVYPSNYSLQFDEYDVVIANEYPDYYLYETNRTWDILSAIGPIIDPHDNQVFDYTISSSVTSSFPLFIDLGQYDLNKIGSFSQSLPNTNLPHYGTPYFTTSSGYYVLENTPNVPLIISASLVTSGSSTGRFQLILNRQGNYSILANQTYGSGANVISRVSCSYYGIQEDQIFLTAYKSNLLSSSTLKSCSISITQSWNNFILDTWYGPSTSSCAPTILEPYIEAPNYYYSDYNPTMNNINSDRLSTIYEDVAYYPGITVPTNFGLIISGSAFKAAVQDSNYTSKRVINPRYNGVKSTNQYLNTWTPGDTGTYGKTPSTQNLKTMVAYCDWISGWPPERMNASAIHIQYLIKSDGSVVIPNTSENSLYDNKGTFESGERLIIEPKTISSGQATQYRNILRGGTRIEPILYTQIGHTPPNWTSSISLYNGNSSNPITDNSLNATLNPSPLLAPYAQEITNIALPIGYPPTTGGWNVTYDPGNNWASYVYNVDNDTILEGCNLIIEAQFVIRNGYASDTMDVTIYPRKDTTPAATLLSPPQQYQIPPNTTITVNFNYNLTPGVDFINTDEFWFEIVKTTTTSNPGFVSIVANGSYIKITQDPIPNPLPPIFVASGSIFNYPTSSTYNQASSSLAGIIFIPNLSSSLNTYYNTPGIKQQDISGSGFNSITLDWNVKYGDEFRFEGREDRTYAVKHVYEPTNQSSERISNTGSLEIHLDKALPSQSINLDHFLIRRYIDDASVVLMEGFKPLNTSGPFIVRPEYLVPELNKTVDEFILDLTQKGLL